MESPFLARDEALSLWSRSANSKTLECQRTPKPREVSNSENSHKGNHLYTRCSITQVPVVPVGCLIQTTNTIKIQTKSSADRTITLLSPAPQKKKNSYPPTGEHKSHPTLCWHKPLDQSYESSKGRKNLTLKLGYKRPQTVSLKSEKAEKCCTNEGTN